MRFEGRVALVTGSSRGIGGAIAIALAREGATVVVNCKDDADGARTAIERIRRHSAHSTWIPADVGSQSSVDAMVAVILETHGRVDILVNNAGINADRTTAKMSHDDWDSVINTNLTGVFNCTHTVLPSMIQRGSGAIVSISSVVGLAGNFGQANYAAAKAGIIGFTKSVAREVASKGIRINAVAPGFIDTDMTRSMPADVLTRITEATPMRRLGTVEEVARAVLFLASDDASFITGETLSVNGGFHFH